MVHCITTGDHKRREHATVHVSTVSEIQTWQIILIIANTKKGKIVTFMDMIKNYY